ncbi:MAG: hypothetical protein JST39_17390 [Bacteroidetes bacterium]|nr:hypothetical protein [Bacteroidota bacterium]
MFKRLLFLGLLAGILAGAASLVYQHVYLSSLGADFSRLVRPAGVFASSILGCLLASIGYWLFDKWLKQKGEIVFNLLFTILSIASILAPFAAKLPLDVETPELFPGLVVPMHFFPVLGWYTLKPLFVRK